MLVIILVLGAILTQGSTVSIDPINLDRSKYEELMLTTKNSDKLAKKNDPNKSRQFLQSQNRGFPDRLLLPRGWTEGMPMQVFAMVTPIVEKSLSMDHAKPARRVLKKCSPDGQAYGFPFDRPIDNEQSFKHSNMFFKDVKIYHDEDYLVKNFRETREAENVREVESRKESKQQAEEIAKAARSS